MANYSGTAAFDFQIERYLDKESGRYLTEEQLPNDDDFEFEYQVINLKVAGDSYYQSGRYYGRPEDCYPDEGETEITGCIGPGNKDWTDQLTKSERDAVLEMIQERVVDDIPEPDFDDYYDDRDY